MLLSKGGKKHSITVKNNEVAESEAMSVGALAGIMTMATYVKKAIDKATGIKVPHLLYDQLRWSRWIKIKKNPPSHPLITLSVTN